MPPLTPAQIVALIVVAIAAVVDLRTQKIPNLLTFPAALAGVMLQFIQALWHGALSAVEGWFVGVIVMLAVKLAGSALFRDKTAVGFGDAKLVGAIGALLGPTLVLLSCFYYFLCYGIAAALLVGAALPWRRLASSLFYTGTVGQLSDREAEKLLTARKRKIPIAFTISIGALFAIFFEQPTLIFLGFAK